MKRKLITLLLITTMTISSLAACNSNAELEIQNSQLNSTAEPIGNDEFTMNNGTDNNNSELSIPNSSLEEPQESATPEPTATAVPTAVPTEEPTEAPTAEPTTVPTQAPTEAPTEAPTVAPTSTPEPTAVPTPEPTPEVTPEPTEAPTEEPISNDNNSSLSNENSELRQEEATPAPTEPPHEHSYSVTSQTSATCTEGGSVTYSCDCGDSYSESVASTGHSFGAYVYNNDATSEADGTETATCSGCGAVDTRTATGTKVACDHSDYGWRGDTPTGTGPYNGSECIAHYGIPRYRCHTCGHTWAEEERVSGVAHSPLVLEEGYQPTCTTEGKENRNGCSCGERNETESRVIPANGHSWQTRDQLDENGNFVESADGMRVLTYELCISCGETRNWEQP